MLSGDTRLVPFATKLGFVFVHFRFRFPESPGSSVVGVSAFNFSMTNNPQIVLYPSDQLVLLGGK
ncbi:hypothetical protein AXX17_AT5G00660 [Arabidopsis thaliana]|uniref:Uncharacterized protein n=1 Tax=Arabidopsis thaliana TaxID=3702 RepID=A0A178URS4_ARATH|nr:hypothetical protein AXX17_AT5G00660 [Arabidopsis thaliana]